MLLRLCSYLLIVAAGLLPWGGAQAIDISPSPSVNMYQSGGAKVRTLFSAPLTSDLVDDVSGDAGTFTRATASTCSKVAGSGTVTDLASGDVCQDNSLGLRLSEAATNISRNSEAFDTGWMSLTGGVITGNDADAPDGSHTAERLQLSATGKNIYNATAAPTTELIPVVHSLFIKSRTADCTIWIGNAYTTLGVYSGETVPVTTSWTRVYARAISPDTGTATPAIARRSAADTCSDMDIWGYQVEASRLAPGQYCPTGTGAGAAAVCNAETLSWTSADRIDPLQGTVTFTFNGTDKASWNYPSVRTLYEVQVTAGTFAIQQDVARGQLAFLAGGQTLYFTAPWGSWTGHTARLAFASGRPISIQWDNDRAKYSSGNYVAPTLTGGGSFYIGSSAAGAGQVDGFIKDFVITNGYTPSDSAPTFTYYATLQSAKTPEVGATAVTTSRATAWTCPAEGGATASSIAINADCYIGEGGGRVGLRVGAAVTTRTTRGDVQGAVGAVPTSWLSFGANYPLVTEAAAYYGSKSGVYTEGGDANQCVYQSGVTAGTNRAYSYFHKTSAAVKGVQLAITNGAGTIAGNAVRAGTYGWERVISIGPGVAAGNQYLGSATGYGGGSPPASGTYYFAGIMLENDALHAGPLCVGDAPPVTCGPDSASVDFAVGEISAASTHVTLTVTPFWASDYAGSKAGIDRVILWNSANYKLEWIHADRTWKLTAGGQTATSAAQRFFRNSSHRIDFVTVNGSPITLRVNKGSTVSSGGNYATPAWNATTYLGRSSAGGDECACHIGDLGVY